MTVFYDIASFVAIIFGGVGLLIALTILATNLLDGRD